MYSVKPDLHPQTFSVKSVRNEGRNQDILFVLVLANLTNTFLERHFMTKMLRSNLVENEILYNFPSLQFFGIFTNKIRWGVGMEFSQSTLLF